MAGNVTLLDTHILYWAAYYPEKLAPAVLEAWPTIEREGAQASAISIWEIGIKAKNGKLRLPEPLNMFVRRLRTTNVSLIAVTARIWCRSVELEWQHRDPADRVIVATAQIKKLRVLTADSAIRASGLVELA